MNSLEIRIKELTYLFFLILFLVFIIIGGLMNFQVKLMHDGRMPVKTNTLIDTAEHFSYQDNSEIPRWYLSDRFNIGFGKYYWRYSIGDAVMILAAILLLCTAISVLKFEYLLSKS